MKPRTNTRGVFILAALVMGLALTATAQRPVTGNYFTMSHTNYPPLPYNPYPGVPVYTLGSNAFLIDDRLVYHPSASSRYSTSTEAGPPVPGDGGGGDGTGYTNFTAYPLTSFGSNDLWLQIALTNVAVTNVGPRTNLVVRTNSMARLTLHGTVPGELYQLEFTLNLGSFWQGGEIIAGTAGTNVTDFSLVSATQPPICFFRAHGGPTNFLSIQSFGEPSEPSPTDPSSGFPGFFFVNVTNAGPDLTASDLTAFYHLTGTASNGVDYAPLPGFTNIAADSGRGQIEVVPLFVNLMDFDREVVATLVPGNGYFIDTNQATATLRIKDNISTNSLFQFVTNLDSAVGLGYHPLKHALIASVHFNVNGTDGNFVSITTNALTNLVVTNWTGISNLPNEVKLTIVPTTTNGFKNSDMFFANGSAGGIGWLSANGTASNLNWTTLGDNTILAGGLYVDQTGIFSNDLITVTGDGLFQGGGVWRIESPTNATFLVNITNTHLEGLATVPNDVQRYGPWAGKIITGAESFVPAPVVFAIDTNGDFASFTVGIAPEDIHIICANQDFYCNDEAHNVLLKLPRNLLTNYVGDFIITQEGIISLFSARLFIVHWDAPSGTFIKRSTPLPVSSDTEQGTFAPISLPTTLLPKD